MDKLPRFFRDDAHRQHTLSRLKLFSCPHCHCQNVLVGNGKLSGNDPHGTGTGRIERGCRIRCSNRYERGGCGKSVSIFHAGILPEMSVDAQLLWLFLKALQQALSVYAAADAILSFFSLSSAYRWKQRLTAGQTRLRQLLCARAAIPSTHSADPLQQLIEHLGQAFSDGDNPVSVFQADLQRDFSLV